MKLALLGYGKMGQIIGTMATEKGHEIVYKKGSDFESGTFSEAEVAIDFSVPEAAVDNIMKCLEADIPVVSGTTGWLSEYENVVKKCEACNGSFLYASNFSVGVNLFFNLNAYAAKLMAPWKEYNVSVEEIHHTEKKDAPSGTAITIAEGILEHSDKKGWELDTVSKENITITAKREADVKGTHRVDYESKIDTISLKHQAHTREGFAKGAILAAEWISGKKGIFGMKDVLGLE